MLPMLGLPFTQVGQLIEYQGPRAAFYVSIQAVLDNIQGELQHLYDFVYHRLAEQMQGMASDASVAPLIRR